MGGRDRPLREIPRTPFEVRNDGGPGAGGPICKGGAMRSVRAMVLALPGSVLAVFAAHHPSGLTPETAHHWWSMHVLLIPVFPLLPLALLWLLRGERGPLVWLACLAGYGFAVCYTALDVLAGIGAGLAVDTEGPAGGPLATRMFAVADPIGLAGVWLLIGCAVITTAVLGMRQGPWVVPGGLVLVASGWVFRTSHIFFPVGMYAMIGLATGTALLALAVPPSPPGGEAPVATATPGS